MRKLSKISRRLKDLQVGLLYLIGSQSQGIESPLSDVDIGVVFLTPHRSAEGLKRYRELYSLLSEPLGQEREIDIVFLAEAPLPLRFRAVTEERVLYRVSPRFEVSYKEKVMKEFIDFHPRREEFNRCIL